MKVFVTVRDIEDLAARGVMQVPMGDDIVLTDLAREKATELGLSLVRGTASPASPAPSPAPRAQTSAVSLPIRTPAREIPVMGPKPRGCLHNYIDGSRMAPGTVGNSSHMAEAASGSSTDSVVDQLVAMIRQLSE